MNCGFKPETKSEDRKKRLADCQCLTDERRGFIEAALSFSSDFSDGAFFAFMEERGIDITELEVFSLDHVCTKARK